MTDKNNIKIGYKETKNVMTKSNGPLGGYAVNTLDEDFCEAMDDAVSIDRRQAARTIDAKNADQRLQTV